MESRLRNPQREAPGQLSVYIPPGDTRKETYRVFTFKEFPPTTISPTDLASNGFFYVGYRDRVQCFSCGIRVENWQIGDNPREQHKIDCGFANGTDTSNEPLPCFYKRYLNSNFQQQPPATALLHPVNPHMRSLAARIATFDESRWAGRVRLGIEKIAEAGFFSLGERDRAKCFYCNGGLQNWDYDDEPWFEHAKWFPSCEFVRRIKGNSFVDDITARFPNINRPTPVRQITNPPTPLTVDELVERAIESDKTVIQVKEMGYSIESLRVVLKRKQETAGRLFDSPNDLLDALIEYQAAQPPVTAPRRVETPPCLRKSKSIRERVSEGRCKSCEQSADVVLMPCGHLSVCHLCVSTLRECPVCRERVTSSIKVYRS